MFETNLSERIYFNNVQILKTKDFTISRILNQHVKQSLKSRCHTLIHSVRYENKLMTQYSRIICVIVKHTLENVGAIV